MKTNKGYLQIISCLLVFIMIFSLCRVGSAQDDIVRVGSADELDALATRCSFDRYSEGLTVVLVNDINLDGKELSIPIFLGTFDGNGHKISGLKIISENTEIALFGQLAENAVIRNLQVEGDVTPSGNQNSVGGIVGINYGNIENCSYSGVVMASEQVGGIAGINEAGGVITDCSVSGVIRGKKLTGGIAGENAGSIIKCTNSAAVNTTVTEEDITAAELENLDSAVYDILKNHKHDYEIAVTTDTGGIAGHSSGVLQSCENNGTVGYPHVGYNVGGITGRQSGYISNCVNNGTVLGRKDVGGIVGQMVPDITLHISSEGLDSLQNEISSLQTLIDNMLDDAQSASDTISDQLTNVSGYADSARENINTLAGQVNQFADSNIQAVNGLLLLVERYLSKFVPVMDDITQASGNMTDTITELRTLFEILDGTTEYNEELLIQLRSFCSETAKACEAMEEGLSALERAFALLEGGPAVPDTKQLHHDIAALKEASTALESIVGRAIEELGISGFVTPETKARLKAELLTVLDCQTAVNRDIRDLFINTDFDAIRRQNLDILRQFAQEMRTAMGSFSDASSHMGSAIEILRGSIDILRSINGQMDDAMKQTDAVLEDIYKTSVSLSSAFSKAGEWAGELSEEEPVAFSPPGVEIGNSADALNASIGGISNGLSALNKSVSASGTALLSDVKAIDDQFMNVLNLFINMVNEIQETDYTDIVKDISEESIQSAVNGKVQECQNDGNVSADRNAGGIAGSMAVEYDFDPEDDFLSDSGHISRFTYQTKAILLNCRNSGEVSAKRSCAGGVAGRMDIGIISGCSGFGHIESESGEYAGGVCGFSLSSIRDSFAKCTLSGDRYVGGIVGSGNRVSGCISMVEIDSDARLKGAVGGEITGEYSDNRFVSDTLAGVDRISYAGKAEQISYDEMLMAENLPDEMKQLVLRFVIDDKEVKRLTFNYGDSFSTDIAPEIPSREGLYAVWDKTDFSRLHFDTTVTAEYIPYVTTIAGNLTKNDGRAVFLAEGDFDEKAEFNTEKISVQSEKIQFLQMDENYKAIECWKLDIPQDGSEEHLIHYLAMDENIKDIRIYVKQSGKWIKAQTDTFGSYLVFRLGGTENEIIIAKRQSLWWFMLIPVVIIVFAVIIFIVVYIKRKKHKKTDIK